MSINSRDTRIDLAAILRWAARLGYQQGVCNHFSAMLPDRDDLFLVNAEGLFWSEATASNLLLCSFDGEIVEGAGTVETTAFCLHAPLHRLLGNARAALHTHSPYTTALCLIRDGRVTPANLAGFQFHDRIAYDEEHRGGALTPAEGEREARLLGEKSVLMMRNHGAMVVGHSTAQAFDRLYYLEEVCKAQILAMSSNHPLQLVSDNVAAELADHSDLFESYAAKHLAAIKRVLDKHEPEYAE